MAVGDMIESGARLQEVPPSEATDVRHFDQLSHPEQRAFLELHRGESPDSVPLDAGEVVVFTDYYRIDR
jgi:hypothetical protein